MFAGSGDRAFCVGGDLKEREGMSDDAWRAQHVIFDLKQVADPANLDAIGRDVIPQLRDL